jgi:hypothetical protein
MTQMNLMKSWSVCDWAGGLKDDGRADAGHEDGSADGLKGWSPADGFEEQGRASGLKDGPANGLEDDGSAGGLEEDGPADGFKDGSANGFNDGPANGFNDGSSNGFEDGSAGGFEDDPANFDSEMIACQAIRWQFFRCKKIGVLDLHRQSHRSGASKRLCHGRSILDKAYNKKYKSFLEIMNFREMKIEHGLHLTSFLSYWAYIGMST